VRAFRYQQVGTHDDQSDDPELDHEREYNLLYVDRIAPGPIALEADTWTYPDLVDG
jgi:hypothetical protein